MRLFSICIFAIQFCMSTTAQNISSTIIEDLNSRKQGEGVILIMQDESIDKDVASYTTNTDSLKVIRLSNELINGYKIQVFTGNNQNSSKLEAETKQRLLRQDFPEHQAQISYDSPSWRLRVGNFMTQSEAETVLAELKKTYPKFSKEMHVVNDVIRRPINR